MSTLPGLDFQLGEDVDALRDTVRAFAELEVEAGEGAHGRDSKVVSASGRGPARS